MKILVVGDSYAPTQYFEQAFGGLETAHEVVYRQVVDRPWKPTTPSELKLSEYQGSPRDLAAEMRGVEVLVVQGAPVTDEVLDASDVLRLVCCARGGPVNVDVDAVSTRGLPLVHTPARNADAVADLTIAFLVMLARGLPVAQRFLADGNRVRDNWEGAKFIGSDLRWHTLGLIGFGEVGRRVATRALAFGMTLLRYDPFVGDVMPDVEPIEALDELLARADFVSLHARATEENHRMMDKVALAKMKPGSYLINTARATLVDEDAIDWALGSGRLAGAAFDVFDPHDGPGPHRLLRHQNVVLTPHLGGATHETLLQGAEMIASEITRFAAGQEPINVFNKAALPA